ncbi:hypothetical protein ACN47E_005643 [Coniothyrium glycines]
MTVTFGAICSLLQSVENISTRQPRLPQKEEKESIRQIVINWFTNQRQNLDNPDTNGGAVLSALFPHRRKDRVYGMQACSLERKLVSLLSFNHGQRAVLGAWRTGRHGDLGAYVERAMLPWDGTFGSKREIPIEDVDRLLIQLAAKYRFSDAAIRRQRDPDVNIDAALKEIFIRLESWEAKWMVRLILRDYCTINLEERFVLQQYHFLMPELLMFQNDFEAVFDMLKGDLRKYPAVPTPSQECGMRTEASRELKAVVGVKVGRPTFHKAWSLKHCFQLVGKRAWAAEVKYDGEYCEVHIDLDSAIQKVKIFSKNGKDSTADRQMLQKTIQDALGIGRSDCLFQTNCIVLAEMVLYSDKEKKILPFSKIRKHISRSGSFMGTLQDSLPHEWEHLMLVFFDVLVLDNRPILRHCLQERRKILRDLVRVIPGRSMRSEWTLLDFKTGGGMTDLKQTFAWNLVGRQEGLVLKPLHAPYFPLLTEQGHRQASFFIKLKKDYLSDMGGERDLGDFAIIGASFHAQVAPKTDYKPLHWTHFSLGCCMNKLAVQRTGERPRFKVVATLSLDKCIPKTDLKYLNTRGYIRQLALHEDGSNAVFDVVQSKGYQQRMTVAFKKPFVAEILGGGFEKVQNETFEMLRHPRIKKLHHDRTWEDTVSMEDLERMVDEKWNVPDAEKLDGHARDVALLVKDYTRQMYSSQLTVTTDGTTQQTTPRKTQETTPPMTQTTLAQSPSDDTVLETQQEQSITSMSSTRCAAAGSTQNRGINASRQARILVREDSSERLNKWIPPTPATSASAKLPCLSPKSPAESVLSTTLRKRRSANNLISPPKSKRRKILSPTDASSSNRQLGSFEFDSQEGIIHIYATEGLQVHVHTGLTKKGRALI